MSARLCIDFGTSSIRAAVRGRAYSRPQVLPLGKAIKTRARDEASLLSEIYIDTTKGVVIFGERALVYKQQNLSDPYPIQSPKLWFKDPNNLDLPPFSGLPVTKAQLLAGLLGYAIKAASLALVDLGRVFSANASTILIAHPVWPEDIKSNANNALICVLHRALSIESDFVDELSFSVLSELHQVGFANNGIDVVEPIAAAYELSSAESNLRRLTLVVDVGAGTTDIGLFVHVESANPNDRLIPLPPVRSEFCAGDLIDDTLLKLLAKKAPGVSHRELLEVRRRVRAVKETLFQLGRIFELGVELKLEELEDAQEVKNMQRQIRSATQEILEINLAKVVEWTEASLFQRQYIEILMAGGGANIGFIQRSLELGFYQVGSSRILAKVVSPASNGNVKTYGATIQRMAVALGGANEGYENLLVSMATASSTYNLGVIHRSLGEAKQSFTSAQTTLNIPSNKRASHRGSEATDSPQKIFAHKTLRNADTQRREDSDRALRNWDKKRLQMSRTDNRESAIGRYDLACHLLDYPISRSSPYKKSAIDTLAQAAELGLGRAAEKLAVIYSAEPVTKETLAKAYYWQHVAAKLSRQAASSVGISDLAGLLSAEERALAIDMASRFRVVTSDPIQSLVRNTSPGNVGRAAPTRHRGGRHLPKGSNREPDGHVISSSEQLIVLSLIKTSRNLRAPASSDIVSVESILRWAKTRDVRGAMFLALRFSPGLHAHALFKDSDVYKQVRSWIDYAKRYER